VTLEGPKRFLVSVVFFIFLGQVIKGKALFLLDAKDLFIGIFAFAHFHLGEIGLRILLKPEALHHPLALGIVIVYLPGNTFLVYTLTDCGHACLH
jgi:hypothetical protein